MSHPIQPSNKIVTTQSFEAQVYDHADKLLRAHDIFLRDAVRNRAFFDALERVITPESKVVDIGSGSGIWAITAAKLGAKHAVAVDTDEFMIGMIRMLAAEHGVGDRVHAIWGSSFDVQLEKEFDIVVSETIGFVGYDENIVEIMCDARERFLKPGGKLIPEMISLRAAPVCLHIGESVPAGLAFDFAGLQRLDLNSPYLLTRPDEAEFLAEPKCLIETDLYTAEAQTGVYHLVENWETNTANTANCFAVWVESRLTDGVYLSTRDTTSWTPTLYRFEPFVENPERIHLNLALDPEGVSWTASTIDDGREIKRQYSPAFAAAEMVGAARVAGQFIQQDGRLYPATETCEVTLRKVNVDDKDFLLEVFSSSQRDGLAAIGWPKEQQDIFLAMQFDIQTKAYAMQSPEAESSVILSSGERAGRLVVDRSGDQITLTDIAVLPQFKRMGIATFLIRQLQNEAADEHRPVLLHVEKVNRPALKLYENLGFSISGETDLHYEMKWTEK